MLANYISKILRGYKVIKKKTNDGPLPSMTQYYLQSDNGQPLSFWNDIPLGLQNDIIPKQKHGKFEVKKHIPFHPIMQDTRKNIFSNQLQLRFYNQFPLFNYGYIPQTWEQNLLKDEHGLLGDDDPIDICDLTQHSKQPGDVFRGKVLGSFCLIDQGEIDWKIFVIDQNQSKKSGINKIEDVNPKKLAAIKSWFKVVKVYDGKKPNTIAYNEKIFTKQQTLDVISHTRRSWLDLMRNESDQMAATRKRHSITKRQTNIEK